MSVSQQNYSSVVNDNSSVSEDMTALHTLYNVLYADHSYNGMAYEKLLKVIANSIQNRSITYRNKDKTKANLKTPWVLDNALVGMSLYVDRFCGNIKGLEKKLDYLKSLGVNLLHLMPLFASPADESDGGYAVSDYRTIDFRYGHLKDLTALSTLMHNQGMHLMLDIVLNHCSHLHDWAQRAKNGDPYYQEYFYMYDTREIPDRYERTMPEIFPESSPNNFTYIPECKKWVMTVFHHYQWDLNFSNPLVLVEMIDIILFYANLGVDLLRIDAPAFIWKKIGTTCQNLDEAHTILQLIKQVISIASPGMALLGEAIVAPHEIMRYFGSGDFEARECDFAYNATLMALQWDALATGKTNIMKTALKPILTKPYGTSWISYTRCHDDIGLGYSDEDIQQAGFHPFLHRQYIHQYYSGAYPGSPSRGALFSVNPKTQDARISGSLASLCGLEYAIELNDTFLIDQSIKKIILLQAVSMYYGGLVMLFYGDEIGYTNDYSYLQDEAKVYDNRWMHRPMIDWQKNNKSTNPGTIEYNVFSLTQKLISIRQSHPQFADTNNLCMLQEENSHVLGFCRFNESDRIFCLFNYSAHPIYMSWYIFKEFASEGQVLIDLWSLQKMTIGPDQEHFMLDSYSFGLLKTMVN